MMCQPWLLEAYSRVTPRARHLTATTRVEREVFELFKPPRGPSWRPLRQYEYLLIALRVYLEQPSYHQ